MLTEKLKELVLIILLIVAIAVVQGQQANMTEEDVIAKAGQLFDQENWVEALPLYAQLVSVNPEIPEYNYKFGVCTLLGNRSDRRRPIRYLNKAYRTMSDNADLLYYLGLAYYQNQEFANAMKFLNLYLAKLDPNSPQRPSILEQINACLNGMNLEHKNLIEEIVSTTEFQIDNFYRAYRADDLEGSLILKPENFVTDKEKSEGIKSFVFVSEPRGVLYFSGYSKESPNQRDIYKVVLKENGNWDKPEKIAGPVNTNFDEAYPVLTDNGQTLYFSSKGHNSLGGFDVFKSTLDPSTEEFGTPENMGIGINSPFDDILFIPDNTGHGAYFSSNRDNLGDGINVFRIRLNEQMFGDQQMLAEQSIQTKLENAVKEEHVQQSGNPTASIASSNTVQKSAPVDPQRKAANLLQQRAQLNKMADTAYLLVSNMKNMIRDLTNKRDRANMVSTNKMDQAKKLEIEFDKIINDLPLAENKETFEKQLSQAVKYKEDIYQYRQRADQANLIAWNLGKQIKIKNEELNQLKLDAGEVQTFSVAGDFEQTRNVYSTVVANYEAADTLTDYAQNIKWINLDKIRFDIPETEMAFANQMRQGYENQTLLAMTQSKNAELEKFDESVPIRVVDKRPSAQQAAKPAVVVLTQVEEVPVDLLATNEATMEEEDLELRFAADAIDPYELVLPVDGFEFARNEAQPDEELEINFSADALQPFELIQPVAFEEATIAGIEETELELNFGVDRIEAADLVQSVEFAFTDIDLEDEVLEINNAADWIAPAQLIEPIQPAASGEVLALVEEELEINNSADWITPDPLIEVVSFNESAYAVAVEEEELNLNERIDWVEPSQLIQPVAFNEEMYAVQFDEEELIIDAQVDWIEAATQVEEIEFASSDLMVEEEDLELNERIDWIAPKQVVDPVEFAEVQSTQDPGDELLEIGNLVDPVVATPLAETIAFTDTGIEITEEQLEINFTPDTVEPYALTEPIAYTDSEDIAVDEPELEIRNLNRVEPQPLVAAVDFVTNGSDIEAEEILEVQFAVDGVDAEPQVEAIAYSGSNDELLINEELEIGEDAKETIEAEALVSPVVLAAADDTQWMDDQDLEIRFNLDVAEAQPLVEAVSFAAVDPLGNLEEEALELNFSADAVEAQELVQPVLASGYGSRDFQVVEELEIRMEEESAPAMEAYPLVETIAFSNPGMEPLATQEELEIGFGVDQPEPIEAYAQVRTIAYTDYSFTMPNEMDELEIKYTVDADDRESLMADNASISERDVAGIEEMPTADDDLYFLRESVSMAANIETSRTDIELLQVAIENPEDLSYEELLFAASLAPIPEDKLRIYNYAFIHIDRDWRAFNNAAVTAMNVKDLDQAEVYLYQASLISDDNGKVENNKGILACYKNDFRSAETHFLAANQMGVNAEYNLQLIQNLINTSIKKNNKLKREMGKVHMNK